MFLILIFAVPAAAATDFDFVYRPTEYGSVTSTAIESSFKVAEEFNLGISAEVNVYCFNAYPWSRGYGAESEVFGEYCPADIPLRLRVTYGLTDDFIGFSVHSWAENGPISFRFSGGYAYSSMLNQTKTAFSCDAIWDVTDKIAVALEVGYENREHDCGDWTYQWNETSAVLKCQYRISPEIAVALMYDISAHCIMLGGEGHIF